MSSDSSASLITLQHADTTVSVTPTGGCITRYATALASGAIEWLRPATPDALAAGDPRDMACFPLVPFSGRIRDGRFSFQGRDIVLPLNFLPERHTIHGHGWKAAWEVVDQSTTATTIAYSHDPDAWPFPYRAEQRFALEGHALRVDMTVYNTGNTPMSAGFGLHPYFIRTAGARVTATISQCWITDDEVMPTELITPWGAEDPTNGLIPAETAVDYTYVGWQRHATISWPEWDASLDMDAQSPLEQLVLFTPPGEDFFCVEPVSNIADAFNYAAAGHDDTGMLVIAPGESVSAATTFTPNVTGI